MPLVALGSGNKFGVGAFGRLYTPKSKSEIMYSTAKKEVVANVEYDLTDNLSLRLVKNDYIDGGWMGGQLPGYGAELIFNKDTKVPQANALVRNFLSAGIY